MSSVGPSTSRPCCASPMSSSARRILLRGRNSSPRSGDELDDFLLPEAEGKEGKRSMTIAGRTGEWEIVIGLEAHAQVIAEAKLFSGAAAAFGAEPNTQ